MRSFVSEKWEKDIQQKRDGKMMGMGVRERTHAEHTISASAEATFVSIEKRNTYIERESQ